MNNNKLLMILSISLSIIGLIFVIVNMFNKTNNNIYLEIGLICIVISNLFNILRKK